MRRYSLISFVALVAVGAVFACDDDDNGPTVPAAELFTANLDGASERPTPRVTPATGTANFTFRRDTLSWVITMQNITNVFAAHIHIGGVDVAAGILLLLSTPPSNTQMSGFITRSTYVLPGAPNDGVTFDSLLVLMRTQGSYVNVHTNDNTGAQNTGPGDFPGGEIRGQIRKTS